MLAMYPTHEAFGCSNDETRSLLARRHQRPDPILVVWRIQRPEFVLTELRVALVAVGMVMLLAE